jgi:hypothetical protein
VVPLFGLSLIVIPPETFPDLTAFHPTFGSDMHFLCRSKNVALCKHEESRTDQTRGNLKVQSSTDGQHCHDRFGDKDIHFYLDILHHNHSISTVTVS